MKKILLFLGIILTSFATIFRLGKKFSRSEKNEQTLNKIDQSQKIIRKNASLTSDQLIDKL